MTNSFSDMPDDARLWVRAGATYDHVELESEGGDITADSGHGLGWEAGSGLVFALVKVLSEGAVDLPVDEAGLAERFELFGVLGQGQVLLVICDAVLVEGALHGEALPADGLGPDDYVFHVSP